ncbi:MAG: 1-acyl-sn-glycerol-3-phosphate acyltransferase [Lachnospiraceae bacterium]|nr:1-acyl-sn-glycerol-3-phosphate acyltransferase [Lachnospiraceae bacterium]
MKIKQGRPNYLLLFVMKLTGFIPTLIFFKPKIYYQNRKAQGRHIKGAAILMSNHTAFLDFILYMLIFVERIPRFLMAEVLFTKNKLFTWLLFGVGGIYLNRDKVGGGFVTHSLKTLERGGVVGVFPQGRLPVPGQKFPFKPGITMIAMKTDAPIIPIYTDGNYGINKRAHVMIGEPIYLREQFDCTNPTKEDVKKMTQYLESVMDSMQEEVERQKAKK